MQSIRNVAIIAHVDHGKTTLVDKIIRQCMTTDEEESKLILDNNDLERERGITIVSKNIAVQYKDTKINIIDTPGHADFGGEVERVLKMADGVLLLVDAFEGPMPQTRFVLQKALELKLKPIVVVNKVDKENCQPDWVHEQVFDLMFNLEATEEQLDFTTLYGSSKHGWMSFDHTAPKTDLNDLLDTIIKDVPPAPFIEGVPKLQITSLDFSAFVGRIAIGRLYQGILEKNKDYALIKADDKIKKVRVKEIQVFDGLGRKTVDSVHGGDLCALVGIDDFDIGDTITDVENPEPMPRIAIDEPTMSMRFTINTSPFFGKEGKFVTSRHLRDRLYKETEINLALKVVDTEREDTFDVYGRGVLHISVLIETMRREGYEFQVGRPQVTFKETENGKQEPYEVLVIDIPEEYSGKAIEMVTQRKGDLLVMEPKGELQHIEFEIPTRGLIGLRGNLLSATAGEAIISHQFKKYDVIKEGIPSRTRGSLISSEQGQALPYAIDRLQDRGRFFIDPGEQIYKGLIVGEHTRENDLEVNLIKGKKLTNMRASGSDSDTKIAPKIEFSLEEALEYIKDGEWLEVTPLSIRMRKG